MGALKRVKDFAEASLISIFGCDMPKVEQPTPKQRVLVDMRGQPAYANLEIPESLCTAPGDPVSFCTAVEAAMIMYRKMTNLLQKLHDHSDQSAGHFFDAITQYREFFLNTEIVQQDPVAYAYIESLVAEHSIGHPRFVQTVALFPYGHVPTLKEFSARYGYDREKPISPDDFEDSNPFGF